MAFIGHSQGTTSMFAAMAKDPEKWNDRISTYLSFAPGLIPTKEEGYFLYNNEAEMIANIN